MRLPRIVVSAPHRSSGKSTVTTGLCAALGRRGVPVQPFKKGPDFIDPMWLSAAAGRQCRTLDFFMMGSERITGTFGRYGRGDGVNLIECNHGLHDGIDVEGSDSSAALAKLLAAPVLLVVNARRMSRGVAPLLKGQIEFDGAVNVAGIVLNNVNSSRQEMKIRAALERYCDVPVFGVLPFVREMEIAERHLGLTPLKEDPALEDRLDRLGRAMEEHLDIDAILQAAENAPGWSPPASPAGEVAGKTGRVRLGVALDRAFNFYYPENLEALEAAGADIVYFSPLEDSGLPEVDGLYIGGGFPEYFMDELEGNDAMRAAVRTAVEKRMPVWAECGGLMYLSRRMHWQDKSAAMAGVLPCEVEMSKRPAGHGYVVLEESGAGPWPQSGRSLRGHEFHHSRLVEVDGKAAFAYRTLRGSGSSKGRDGMVVNNCIATYTHLHHDGAPFWAGEFVDAAERFSRT